MKAIFVKYLPASATRGSRLKAWDCDGNSVIVDYPDHVPDNDGKHFEAVKALCEKMHWDGTVACGWGAVHNYSISTWVFLSADNTFILPEA